MNRLAAALIALLIATGVNAQPVGRDSHLRGITRFCPEVFVEASLGDLEAEPEALRQFVMRQALLYDFPASSTCIAVAGLDMATLRIDVFHTLGGSLAVMLNVLVNEPENASIWAAHGLSGGVGNLVFAHRAEELMRVVFEDLVLTWRRENR